MGIARTVGVLGSLLSLLAAQQEPKPEAVQNIRDMPLSRTIRLPDLGRYDTDLPEGAQAATNRLRSLLERTVAAGRMPETTEFRSRAGDFRGPVFLMTAPKAKLDAVQGVLSQLGKEAPLQARLQCSLVTLPLSVAQAQNLQDGRVVAVDAETVDKLVREATKNKGTLCNLPEVTAGPLAPFYIESPRKPDAKEATTLRLRGEMLPLDDREVAVAMHLVRGALPVDKTREPDSSLLQPVFRLQASKCALVTVVEGETATVLVVRCVEVAAKAPAPAGR